MYEPRDLHKSPNLSPRFLFCEMQAASRAVHLNNTHSPSHRVEQWQALKEKQLVVVSQAPTLESPSPTLLPYSSQETLLLPSFQLLFCGSDGRKLTTVTPSLCGGEYSFPMALVTKHHILSG